MPPDRAALVRVIKDLVCCLEASFQLRPVQGGPAPASDNAVDNATNKEDAPGVGAPAAVVGMDRQEFRSRRKAAGLTMAQAGAVLGVTERTVWRWEHGTSRIDPWKAEAIRRMLTPGLWAKIREQDELSGNGDR